MDNEAIHREGLTRIFAYDEVQLKIGKLNNPNTILLKPFLVFKLFKKSQFALNISVRISQHPHIRIYHILPPLTVGHRE